MRTWGAVATVAAALAAPLMMAPVGSAKTFQYTGKEQTYVVPAGITGLHVILVGAAGSAASQGSTLLGAAGHGAELTADISIPSGASKLFVEIGGTGTSANPPSIPYASTGGRNGGGNGPFGGGGATDIRTLSCGTPSECANGGGTTSLGSRLAVAGGGGAGGGGMAGGGDAAGGSAGNTDGTGMSGGSTISGTGGTATFGGEPIDQATLTSYCITTGGNDGAQGVAGDLGGGGNAAYLFIQGTLTAGAGGGGLYGGGGGSQCYSSPGAEATGYSGAGGGGSSGGPGAKNIHVHTDSPDAAQAIVTSPVPTDKTKPTLTGGVKVGDVLTEHHGTWTSTQPVTRYAYHWERCNLSGTSCTAIHAATGRTYKLKNADVGHKLRVQETASNFYGPAQKPGTSAASKAVVA